MARLIFSESGIADMTRLADFLFDASPDWAAESAPLILGALEALRQHPLIGRPVEVGFRELLISRGRTGYVALYRYNPGTDTVLVLGVRHQREIGFS
jgi:plasmid stabilization system protein ParE